MSEPSNGAWPFQEIPEEEGLDISAIFGNSSAAPQGDPFAPPAAAQSVPLSPTPVAQEITPAVAATSQPTTAPIAKAPVEAPAENPIAAAFEQKTAENTKKGLLEKPPVFYHKGVKEEIDDPSMTFEELRIRKSDDFTDLEEGKGYSHMKKAELVLKGYVSESSSTQLTSLNIAINGGLAMGHYWKGRLLLEQAKQDHDRCNDYKDAAIASFCATNVTERFDHLPENADEDAAPQLSPPQWLSAIELLRYPDRAVFRVDRRMVFQTIYQKLTQQVEEVQSDNIQIHNERYRLTKKDVRSNLERCLDMVKAQFPDKEPLIQKMIRSIR